MRQFRFTRAVAVAGVCAVVGAGAGIAGVAAAPSKKSSSSAKKSAQAKARALRANGLHGFGHRGFGGPMGAGGPPVHSEAVVPNAAGTGFDTVTTDAGVLQSVDGSKLTIKEGTAKATYKTVTLDIPSNATIVRNHAKAKLSDLKADDEVRVVTGPQGTFVMAEDAAFHKAEQAQRQRGGWGHGPDGDGPHMRPGAFGPPPAA